MTKEQMMTLLEKGRDKYLDLAYEPGGNKSRLLGISFGLEYAIEILYKFDFGPEEPNWDETKDNWW